MCKSKNNRKFVIFWNLDRSCTKKKKNWSEISWRDVALCFNYRDHFRLRSIRRKDSVLDGEQ